MADSTSLPQGYAHGAAERLPMPPTSALDEAQRAAAQALIDGPRKGVYGPFLPLLRSPVLLDRVAKLGEYLRFESVLDARDPRARHLRGGAPREQPVRVGDARAAGGEGRRVAAGHRGAAPGRSRRAACAADEQDALDFAQELLATAWRQRPHLPVGARALGRAGRRRTHHAGWLLRDGVVADERGSYTGASR